MTVVGTVADFPEGTHRDRHRRRARGRRLQHRRPALRAAQPLRAHGRAGVRRARARPARSWPTPTAAGSRAGSRRARSSRARGTGSSTTCRAAAASRSRRSCCAATTSCVEGDDVVVSPASSRRPPAASGRVTKPLSSPAKNAIARATSSTSPRRLIDCAASTPSHSASWSAWIAVAAVGNAPGRDGVDADALRPGLAGERAGEADHRALGRDVGDEPRLAPVERHRGDVDDRAAAAGEHLRAHRLGEQEVAAHVGGEDRVPLRGVGLVPRAERVDRGVVDEDVGAAERLLGARGDRLDLRPGRRGPPRSRAPRRRPPRSPRRSRAAPSGCSPAASTRAPRAASSRRRGGADAGRGAGDDRGLAGHGHGADRTPLSLTARVGHQDEGPDLAACSTSRP